MSQAPASAPDPTSTSTPPAPQSSALPPPTDHNANNSEATIPSHVASDASESKVKPQRKPLLRLELRDLSSDGAHAFLRLLHASTALDHAVNSVLTHLYTSLDPSFIPPTRSITLVLRDMDGVAYTTGLDIDSDHKEIHLSTSYISSIPASRQKEEITGVLVHEMVHCWQHDAQGTAPGGLIEGIADWVRLKAGYAPPHWKKHGDCDWDAGYERTGFFLEWLEKEHGADVVRKINQALKGSKYDAEKFWHGCCGKSVGALWGEYKKGLEKEAEKPKDEAAK